MALILIYVYNIGSTNRKHDKINYLIIHIHLTIHLPATGPSPLVVHYLSSFSAFSSAESRDSSRNLDRDEVSGAEGGGV